MLWISKGFDEVHLVFDRYIKGSLKERTRRYRTNGEEVRYRVTDETCLSNTTMKKFLSHIETKQDLTVYLSNKVIEKFTNIATQFVVTFDTKSVTNINDLSISTNHDHEEADTLLILHATEIAQRSAFSDCVIYSPDTDVFLLLIHFYESLPILTKFKTGKGEYQREINIGTCFESLGPLKASAILGFHTFTGCDQTGKFNGKSKSTCWKTFMKCDSKILTALSDLGTSQNLPRLETLEALEYFVVQLYGGDKLPSHIQSLPQLRWHLYSKYQLDAEKLPPTTSALKYKVFRCHFVTMVLRKSLVAIQNLPPPEGFGWEKIEDSLQPIMNDNLPAPIALIELSMCGCKTVCTTNRCKCRKNGLPCTDMCKCLNCKNDGTEDDDSDSDLEFDDEEIDDI